MKKAKKHFHLKNRLFLAITFLILVSVSAVSLTCSLWYQDYYIKNASKKNQAIVDQIALNTGSYIDELSRLSLAPYYNSNVMELLDDTPESDIEKLNKKREIEGFLREVMTIPRKEIIRVYIFSDDIYYSIRTPHSLFLPINYQQSEWYQNAMQSSQMQFLPAHTESENGYTLSIFSLVRQIRSLSADNHNLGIIRVDANFDGISNVLNRVALNNNSALLIVDDSSNLIYKRSLLSSDVSLSDFLELIKGKVGINNIVLNSKEYIANIKSINNTDWHVVEITSKSDMLKDTQAIHIATMIIAIISSLLGLLVTGLFVRSFIKPINATVDIIQTTQNGDLSIRAPECEAEELNFLNKSYNNLLDKIQEMISSNQKLTKKMYEAEYLQKKAQYDSLHQQIQPHFMFNTLNTISLLIKSNKKKESLETISDLSVILRGMVNSDSEITISSELKIVKSYLSLQARRHEALSFEIQADPDLDDILIPALTIQPIVENCILHGCEPKCGPTHIFIKTEYVKHYAKIYVKDDGIGIDKKICEDLNRKILNEEDNRTETSGVGLVNIAKRLRLKYGDNLMLTVSSSLNEGTITTISIPIKKGEKNVK